MTGYADKILGWHTADEELRRRFLEVFCANALDGRRYVENTVGPVLVLSFFWNDFPWLPLVLWLITPPTVNLANLLYTRRLLASGPIEDPEKTGLVFVVIAFLYAVALGGGFAYLYGIVSVEARVLLLILTWFGTGAVAITPYASIPGVMYARVIPVSICIVSAVALQGDWAFTAGVSIITLWVCFRLRYVQSYARTLESEYLLQRQLQEAHEIKDRFLAVTSHEIRTPIHGILGLSDVLAETDLSEKQRRYVAELRTAGEHLRGLLDDILDFSRLDAGKTMLAQHPVSPRRIAEDVFSVVKASAENKGLRIVLTVDDHIPDVVLGDDQAIRQILNNLMANAVKFSDDGEICLRVSATHETAKRAVLAFVVIDQGPGIDPSEHKLIFDSFAQARFNTPHEHSGTGLGLAICQELATLMDGEITLVSAPGAGSTFTLEAPFEVIDAPEAVVDADANTQPGGLGGLRILSVEDSELNRFVLREFLAPYDCHIDEAVDAETALRIFDGADFDLVITDLRLPGMDGTALVGKLRELERSAGQDPVPIIVLSASALPEDRAAVSAAGATEFWSKPIRKKDLIIAVHRVAGKPNADFSPEDNVDAPAIEPELVPLLPRFVDEIRQSAMDIDDAAALKDFAAVSRIAHQARGHCRMFRFTQLDSAFADLEQQPKVLESLNLSPIIAALQTAVESIDTSEISAGKALDGSAQNKNN